MEDVAHTERLRDPSGAAFQARRVFGFVTISLLYALVFFQRMCPSIVASEMARTYGVEKSDLSIFSSIFFYPYGLIQPFAGLLADMIDPAFLIGGAQLLASIGAIICGASPNLAVGCVGRFLVGLGCGPTYVPVCRSILYWFPHRLYAHMSGVLLAIGGVGGILAQGPLASLAGQIGWRSSFYGVGGLGILLSVVCLVFVRGNPTSLGFGSVNIESRCTAGNVSIKDRLMLLWMNFRQTVTFGFFWVVVLYCILLNGPWHDLSGMWVAPWLEDVFGYATQTAGNTAIALTIGLIAGSLLIPPLSTFLRTRKWVLCVTAAVAFAVSLVFLLVRPEYITYPLLYFLLIVIGATTNAMSSVAYPLVREYYHPAIAGTAVGCANTFTFLSSAAYQTLSSDLIKRDGSQDDNRNKYTLKGYRNGLWLVFVISWGLGAFVAALTRDAQFRPADSDSTEQADKSHGKHEDELDEV